MGTYLDKEAELEDRVRILEQRVNNLETVGKPKYGLKHESAVLNLPVVSKRSELFICPKCKSDQTYANAALTNWTCIECKNIWAKNSC